MRLIIYFVVVFTTLWIQSIRSESSAFKVGKVIEVNPPAGEYIRHTSWSPLGRQLACMSDTTMLVYDTLGELTHTLRVEEGTKSFKWLDESKLVVRRAHPILTGNLLCGLYILDVSNRKTSQILDTCSESAIKCGIPPMHFWGPFKSVEGPLYYTTTDCRSTVVTRHQIPANFLGIDSANAVKRSISFLSAGTDGTYLISPPRLDSVRISTTVVNDLMFEPPQISADKEYLLFHNSVIRLRDESVIDPGKLMVERPNNSDYCGLIGGEFHPSLPEIMGIIECDDYHDEKTAWMGIGILNCLNMKVTILDTLIHRTWMWGPSYSPVGNRISVISGGKVLIIERDWN